MKKDIEVLFCRLDNVIICQKISSLQRDIFLNYVDIYYNLTKKKYQHYKYITINPLELA